MNNTKKMSALCLLLLTACTRDDGQAARLEEILRDGVQTIEATGVVSVRVDAAWGDARAVVSAGHARLEDEEPVPPDARFRIASTTKTFVMALALRLVEDGALGLDDTVDTWLPGLVASNGNDGTRITLRHLLGHRSGIANHVDDLFAMLGEAASASELEAILTRTWRPSELVALATSHPPIGDPGERFAYSDTGYVLVGMMIEAATGQPWQEALTHRILVPLSLTGTYAPGEATSIEGAHAHGYTELPFSPGLVDVTSVSPSSLDAAASIISTPRDVSTFFGALLRGDLFGRSMMEAMLTMLPVGDDTPLDYGLGLTRGKSSCGALYMHAGDTLGYHTRNGVSEDGTRVVTVAITGEGDFEEAAATLIDEVLCRRP